MDMDFGATQFVLQWPRNISLGEQKQDLLTSLWLSEPQNCVSGALAFPPGIQPSSAWGKVPNSVEQASQERHLQAGV